FVLGRARLRSHRAGRHLCPRLSADRRGAPLRHPAASEQDLAHQHDRALMPTKIESLTAALAGVLGDDAGAVTHAFGEVTLVVAHDRLDVTMRALRDRPEVSFELL